MTANQTKNTIPVILGPTASGKTALAIKLARHFNGEIISVDSRQIYRELNIGTGKDLNKYGDIPYHLIDIISPDQTFSVAEFQSLTEKTIKKIRNQNKFAILVAGTGLYLEAILNNYTYSKNFSQPNDSFRACKKTVIDSSHKSPSHNFLLLGIKTEKTELHQKINARVDEMIKQGLVEETKNLIKKYGTTMTPLTTIGYNEIIDYLNKKTSLEEAVSLIKLHTRQFAKRQLTWFRGMEKRNPKNKIYWVETSVEAKQLILSTTI